MDSIREIRVPVCPKVSLTQQSRRWPRYSVGTVGTSGRDSGRGFENIPYGLFGPLYIFIIQTILSLYARRIFAIQASSSESKMSFSHRRDILTSNRPRMNPHTHCRLTKLKSKKNNICLYSLPFSQIHNHFIILL